MHRRQCLTFGAASVLCLMMRPGAALAAMVSPAPIPGPAPRLTGPAVHGNLAIWFLHDDAAAAPAPATLEEAVEVGAVVVHETGNVNRLQIENRSGEEVFVQSGDLVKGGKQDRVLIMSMMLPPHSGKLSIEAFCVEQGRWSKRGAEDVSRFLRADRSLPSRKAKLAIRAPAVHTAAIAGPPDDSMVLREAGDHRRGTRMPQGARVALDDTASRQQEVWASVQVTQQRLSGALGQTVSAAESRSSLQLTLENDRLRDEKARYLAALVGAGEAAPYIVGYVFAVNGVINSGDAYASNALFRKMWAKQLDASVTEAIAERREDARAAPSPDDVLRFLALAEAGASTTRSVPGGGQWETRDSGAALHFRATTADGRWFHRAYVAR